jgi:hypothetical protein
MEMENEEVTAWQKYLVSHMLKQPFCQMWEPVADFQNFKENRYENCDIPLYRFDNQYGIETVKETEYDYRSGIYVYTRYDIILDDCKFDWEPVSGTIESLNKQSIIRIKSINCLKVTRMTNHIISYLDKCTVFSRIGKDDVTVLEILPSYTAAQLLEFIKAAEESHAVNVAALLLEYKNKTYPDFDPMAEFTLEW